MAAPHVLEAGCMVWRLLLGVESRQPWQRELLRGGRVGASCAAAKTAIFNKLRHVVKFFIIETHLRIEDDE